MDRKKVSYIYKITHISNFDKSALLEMMVEIYERKLQI
jgi:hypothetical protein